MTEAEWLMSADPDPMCRYLEKTHFAQRKPRLVAVAWCRRLPDPSLRTALTLVELFADGMVGQEDLRRAERAANEIAHHGYDTSTPTTSVLYHAATAMEQAIYYDPDAPYTHHMTDVSRHIAYSAGYAAAPATREGWERDRLVVFQKAEATERQAMAELVREVLGNPFRPVTLDRAWLTSTVVALARQMYDARDFSPMPILADALQDAGCDNEDILGHCRGPGPHVRGCWVVDLVLGKE
jgi:hypothetical protein